MKKVLLGGVIVLGALLVLWLTLVPFNNKPVIDEFLTHHWQRPLAPHGAPPAHFSELEASLDPAACGQCHQSQYQDWQRSLHSQTMTAGVQWQLRLMPQADVNKCLDCHAPLAEQKALVAIQQGWSSAPQGNLPNYVPATLSDHGLVCAACHVRKHERFAPERRDGSEPKNLAHNGFVPKGAFSSSEFCSSCHQFPENGPRTNGKLRENTYQEWLASPFASQGTQCQSCHMPDRKHQWRGIHYPDMVQQALTSSIERRDNEIHATLINTGAGHLFPTYMVPKVTARLVWVHNEQETVVAEHVIGWMVDIDLTTERFDTRLKPNESVSFGGHVPEDSTGVVELRLDIAPREHYERTFEYSMGFADQIDDVTVSLLRQALSEAKETRYHITHSSLSL